jgi:large subunit ribosomal protein L10
MSKVIKGMMMDEIRQSVGECRDVLVIDMSKLDGVTDNKFRLEMQKKGLNLLQVKNSLAKRALADIGFTALEKSLLGPSTLVWGADDIVSLSKEITKWLKDIKKLEIKGGSAGGEAIDAAGVESLSKSPGRLELLSIISGQILAPGAKLSSQLLGIGGKLASQVKQIADKEEGDAAPAA